MRTWLILAAIWLQGVADYEMSRLLVGIVGPQAECNPLGRLLLGCAGTSGMLYLKLLGLGIYSAVVPGVVRTRARLGGAALGLGLGTYAALTLWWGVVWSQVP